MNGSVNPNAAPTRAPALAPAPAVVPPNHAYSMQHLTPEQQQKIQEDLADRERQASSLAAAGMVAESVSLTTPSVVGQVLQAPPPLGGLPPPASLGVAGGNPPLTSIDWNMDMGGAASEQGLDDLDMDFATLFDTESEMNMFVGGGEGKATLTMGGSAQTTETPNPLNGGNATSTST